MPPLTPVQYYRLRQAILAVPEWAALIQTAQTGDRPTNPEALARELIFVICNSGMNASVAQQIFERVMAALAAGTAVAAAHGHPRKAAAISGIWAGRLELFRAFGQLNDAEVVEWCGRLPHIGRITKFHAAKQLGIHTESKPDRWLQRLADATGEQVQGMCQRLAVASGDRVGAVDVFLWLSLANRLLIVGKHHLFIDLPANFASSCGGEARARL